MAWKRKMESLGTGVPVYYLATKTSTMRAEWRKLLLVNYKVDPEMLHPYLPAHTEFALWQNTCYLSLVGFRFLKVKMGGVAIPFHTNFNEINLRFYVKQKTQGEWHYGVVFLKEIVALPLVSFVANNLYQEHYETYPMKHTIIESENEIYTQYQWKKENDWNTMEIHSEPTSYLIEEQTLEYFLTAQHWGFTAANKEKTFVYAVHHPRWEMYKTRRHTIQIDYKTTFGEKFAFLDQLAPDAVFLVEGSPITLNKKEVIVP